MGDILFIIFQYPGKIFERSFGIDAETFEPERIISGADITGTDGKSHLIAGLFQQFYGFVVKSTVGISKGKAPQQFTGAAEIFPGCLRADSK